MACAVISPRREHALTVQVSATELQVWSGCDFLNGRTTGYLHPQTLILPSARYPLSIWAPVCCKHLAQGKSQLILLSLAESAFLPLSSTSA